MDPVMDFTIIEDVHHRLFFIVISLFKLLLGQLSWFNPNFYIIYNFYIFNFYILLINKCQFGPNVLVSVECLRIKSCTVYASLSHWIQRRSNLFYSLRGSYLQRD